MPKYIMIAKVNQIVTKEVRLLVSASSEEEAVDKARQALQVYPKPTVVEGVNRMVTNKSTYWIPRDIEFVEIGKDKEQ